MSVPARPLTDPNDTGPRPAARSITWNGRDLPPEFATVPPGDYQLVPLPLLDAPYPLDLSDLSPRALAALERREGLTAEQIRAFRATMTPEQTRQMRVFERSILAMGMTMDDYYDPPPLSETEKADLRASFERADVSEATRFSLLRDLDRA